MITVRTRSSRFFVVLLHLLGVSTHLPSTPGIVGVHPFSVVLETLDPSQLEEEEALTSASTTTNTDSDSGGIPHRRPHWLQDVLGDDQACLHPMGGFSECGDATLWLVIPKKSTKRQALWRQWITWATEEEETEENTSSSRIQGYALQLYDGNSHRAVHSGGETGTTMTGQKETTPYLNAHSPSTSNLSEKECLTRRRKNNQLVLVPCSQERAWAWHFNEDGIMYFRKPRSKSHTYDEKQKKLIKKHGKKTMECLGRNATNAAVLIPCDGLQIPTETQERGRVLRIGLVRQATSLPRITRKEVEVTSPEREPPPAERFPPSQIDKARSHASTTSGQKEKLKGATRMVSFATSKSPTPVPETTLSLPYFKSVNPLLLASGNIGLAPEKTSTPSKKAVDTPASMTSTTTQSRPSIRKIQTNPYVNDAVDERWTDPQTQLVYRTDLCQYLGQSRAEAGRHTLTGVGQYMKTVFNIKASRSSPLFLRVRRSIDFVEGSLLILVLFPCFVQLARFTALRFMFLSETCLLIPSWKPTHQSPQKNSVRIPTFTSHFVL